MLHQYSRKAAEFKQSNRVTPPSLHWSSQYKTRLISDNMTYFFEKKVLSQIYIMVLSREKHV